jgi:hypothetical protein
LGQERIAAVADRGVTDNAETSAGKTRVARGKSFVEATARLFIRVSIKGNRGVQGLARNYAIKSVLR